MISDKIKQRVKILKNRDVFDRILKFLNLPDIVILMGMRQTGKTSLLYLLIDYLLEKKPESNIFYFSLDDPIIFNSFNKNAKELEIYLNNQKVNNRHKIYILIDEIQYLDNPTNFLKYYHDNFPNYKFIVTGSSTFAIREKFKDSLAGRKKIINVNPLTFKEFLEFKSRKFDNFLDLNKISQIKKINVSKIEAEKLKTDLREYLFFGGHPKIINIKGRELKIEELKDIYNSYIKKDIKDIGKIENINSYNQLIQILASQIGGLLNTQEISNTLNINQITLRKYIFLLENSFVIYSLKPFFKNKRKEISKMPKLYFEDVGIRNMIVNDFRKLDLRNDIGNLAENFVFNEINKKLKVTDELYFWRTVKKQEVDFVFKKDNELIPIEVKYKNFKSPKITLGMKNFIENYKAKQAIVVTKDYQKFIKIDKCEVYFVPIYLI
jgi:predicted AAA+ superfamily ATPase